MNRMTKVAAVAALLAAPLLGTVAPASAATQGISGSITCKNWLQQYSRPVGVWVDSQNAGAADGWATLRGGTGMNGAWTSTYSYSATNAGKFRLSVGCGGTPQKWGKTVTTGWLSPGTNNLTISY